MRVTVGANIKRGALAAVLLWQALIAVSLLAQPEPSTVSPTPDMSFTELLLPDDSPPPPAGLMCLPFMDYLHIDGCPIVLR